MNFVQLYDTFDCPCALAELQFQRIQLGASSTIVDDDTEDIFIVHYTLFNIMVMEAQKSGLRNNALSADRGRVLMLL